MDTTMIMDRYNNLKSAIQGYLGVSDVDIDIRIHRVNNNLTPDVLSNFSALGDVAFDAVLKENGRTFAWLKKRLSPCGDITLFFEDYAEAQKYGYKLPERDE